MSRLAQQVIIVLIPPLALIFLVLGTIFLGIATPTEGGAMGAVGALVLAAAKGRLTLDVVRQALASTTRLSAFVMFILIGARVFSLTFYGVNGHIWVEHLLTSLPGGELGFLIVVSLLVFFLAFFLDFFELAFIIVPLLAPAAAKLGIDLIWFGVILGVNMQTSFMHPPFGFALFYLRSVAPREALRRQADRPTDRAGHHGPDLLGRHPLRLHPDRDDRGRHRLPGDGDALQGRARGPEGHTDHGARVARPGRRARRSRRAPAGRGRQPAGPAPGPGRPAARHLREPARRAADDHRHAAGQRRQPAGRAADHPRPSPCPRRRGARRCGLAAAASPRRPPYRGRRPRRPHLAAAGCRPRRRSSRRPSNSRAPGSPPGMREAPEHRSGASSHGPRLRAGCCAAPAS